MRASLREFPLEIIIIHYTLHYFVSYSIVQDEESKVAQWTGKNRENEINPRSQTERDGTTLRANRGGDSKTRA
jgi:hypothetical protein